jgi:hypothetical protein
MESGIRKKGTYSTRLGCGDCSGAIGAARPNARSRTR